MTARAHGGMMTARGHGGRMTAKGHGGRMTARVHGGEDLSETGKACANHAEVGTRGLHALAKVGALPEVNTQPGRAPLPLPPPSRMSARSLFPVAGK